MRLEKVDLGSNAIYEYVELKARATGNAVRHPTAAAERAEAQRADSPSSLYLLRDASGAAAAFGWVRTPRHDHTEEAEVWLGVEPRLRRFGVGEEMLGHLIGEVSALGRTRVTSFCSYAEDGDDAAVRFAGRHDFVVADRMGIWLSTPAEVAAADPGEVPGYRLAVHDRACPEELVAGRAALGERMSREMPQGDLDRAQEWSPERVRAWFADSSAGGRHLLEAVAVTGDGELAGFSDVIVRDGDPVASQRDTYVASEHRGHRLALALKAATAREVLRGHPHVTSLRSFVAESNDPMNRVNQACGYTRTRTLFDLYKDLT